MPEFRIKTLPTMCASICKALATVMQEGERGERATNLSDKPAWPGMETPCESRRFIGFDRIHKLKDFRKSCGIIPFMKKLTLYLKDEVERC
jgi:hypothetical protein